MYIKCVVIIYSKEFLKMTMIYILNLMVDFELNINFDIDFDF